ncbi:MAG: hypothetical protein Q9176_001717 [Flavoplaca citrina]
MRTRHGLPTRISGFSPVMVAITMAKNHLDDNSSPSLEADDRNAAPVGYHDTDVFGREEDHQIQYKTLSWPLVAVLMIAEIVSNGMLSLPSSLAVVGLVPGLVLIIFLGMFALFTSWLLIQFKLRHPEVHNMGDAGYILAGPIGREVLAFGTIVFAVFATGGQLLAGQIALGVLSSNKLCLMLYTGIFAIPTLLFAMPRTLDRLGWLSVFFILISEMRRPNDAMKAAYTLQISATTFYCLFAAITYIYLGPDVASPSFTSLPLKWSKAAYAIAIPNFLMAGSLYSHTAAKLLFIRFFRKSRHLHEHTVIGWGVWVYLIVLMNAAAFVLAIGVPIFNYLIGIAASLFASWYTYGIAGAFWLYDSWVDKGRFEAWKRMWFMCGVSWLTLVAGAFICVAGMYVTVKQVVDAYASGEVSEPFSCS